MKQLAKQYRKNGYDFKEVSRVGNVAIYSQTLPETGKIIAYEVFEIKKNRERIIGGRLLPASESTPSNEEWGIRGFSVPSILAAKVKGAILMQRINDRAHAKSLKQK